MRIESNRLLKSLLVLNLYLSNSVFASGISYSYGSLTGSFGWYSGTKSGEQRVNVHEFRVNDSSGELSASLQTVSNRVSAQAAAENEEREKVRKGESAGGPKTITYSWREEVAREGDMKVYGLRLGSTNSAFGTDHFSPDIKKDGLVTYGELSMIANFTESPLVENENFILKSSWLFGGRWGGINSNDLDRKENKEKLMDGGYLYLPLTYQLKFQSSFNLEIWGEYGGDIITAIRHFASKADTKIPLDIYLGAGVGYRIGGIASVGIKMEKYTGSIITNWGEKIVNPEYTHQLTAAYIALGF